MQSKINRSAFSLVLSFAFLSIATIKYPAHHALASDSSDFTNDVQLGLNMQPKDVATLAVAGKIKQSEYRSSWDEFGLSALINGEEGAEKITNMVLDDVVGDTERQIAYEQREVHYLETEQSSPAEVQAVEDAGGNDVLPQDEFDPHPSYEANPDVNISSSDDLDTLLGTPATTTKRAPIQTETATSTIDTLIETTVPPLPTELVPVFTPPETIPEQPTPTPDETPQTPVETPSAPTPDAETPATP